jgi:hypothetical protein
MDGLSRYFILGDAVAGAACTAEGWLQGHWLLSRPVSEQIAFQGHYYNVHPPLNAVVMLVALKLVQTPRII